MKSTPVFSFPPNMEPKTAMALYELLNEMSEAIWQHYESELVKIIICELYPPPTDQLSFDFDDDIPF